MESEAEVQRQIELQSPEDLAYLIANVRRAAQGLLNDAFPPTERAEADEDDLRVQIERYIQEYINATFTHASPNLSINGLPVDPSHFLSADATTLSPSKQKQLEPQVEYTPWDPRLRQRVEDLARQEEELLNEIAALKKTVPAQVASDTAKRYREAAARDEEAIQARRKAVEEAVASRRDGILEIDALDRQDDVESAHRGAIEGLGKVKREMPSTVAKMERARVAGEYVVSERA
ncbi:hypothetical protein B0T11DRAFT_280115 [Plectosphaerella cucumerina]|uniref:Kinetochore protein mis14 n=1 Tax=Plectosphaerella cucumerina TaxID=40658 RepID=A0A8K0TGJ7_9PEZI|nr:hypothetical protein B0T11DRAFT_280115 [Plectosphaerella cucumerina]